MRAEYGPAVAIFDKDVGEVALQLVHLRITEFNLFDAGDFRLVVFRKVRDCEAYCAQVGEKVAEPSARYYPGNQILQTA